MKVALFSALMILASAGAVRAQDEQNAAQPPTQPPAEAPPAPPAEPPSPPTVMQSPEASTPQPQQQQGTGQGQWVFTSQYGWLWMPYGAQYTYEPPAVQGSYVYPYSYAYYPSYGWAWLYSPWVWGWGPSPYFGYYGPRHFVWYRGPGSWVLPRRLWRLRLSDRLRRLSLRLRRLSARQQRHGWWSPRRWPALSLRRRLFDRGSRVPVSGRTASATHRSSGFRLAARAIREFAPWAPRDCRRRPRPLPEVSFHRP